MLELFVGRTILSIPLYSMVFGPRLLDRRDCNHFDVISVGSQQLVFECTHEGQQTGSMSMKSFGHILRGAWFNRDTTFVAAGWLAFDGGRAKEGQQSGRSSEHPTSGTSSIDPSGNCKAVYCGMAHVPT